MKILRLLVLCMLALGLTRTAQAQQYYQITLDTNHYDVSDYRDHTFTGTMKNLSMDSLRFSFARVSNMPSGWTSSVCFGVACYDPNTDTASVVFGPMETREFIVHTTSTVGESVDSGSVYVRISAATGNAADTVGFLMTVRFIPPNPPIIFDLSPSTVKSWKFKGTNKHTMYATIQHHSSKTTWYHFQTRAELPAGWAATYQFDKSPAVSIDTFGGRFFELESHDVKMMITHPALAADDSAVIYLSVHPQTANPADSMQYRFVANVAATAGVEGDAAETAKLHIDNVWPNPLRVAGTLKLQINAAENGVAKLRVLTTAGNEVATVNLGSLARGSNELSVSDLQLASGTYILSVEQGSTVSPVALISYVK